MGQDAFIKTEKSPTFCPWNFVASASALIQTGVGDEAAMWKGHPRNIRARLRPLILVQYPHIISKSL
jgi:hypothetical protein